jgi:hypothetical protein
MVERLVARDDGFGLLDDIEHERLVVVSAVGAHTQVHLEHRGQENATRVQQ